MVVSATAPAANKPATQAQNPGGAAQPTSKPAESTNIVSETAAPEAPHGPVQDEMLSIYESLDLSALEKYDEDDPNAPDPFGFSPLKGEESAASAAGLANGANKTPAASGTDSGKTAAGPCKSHVLETHTHFHPTKSPRKLTSRVGTQRRL